MVPASRLFTCTHAFTSEKVYKQKKFDLPTAIEHAVLMGFEVNSGFGFRFEVEILVLKL